ncbi:MAG: hypothetical protein ACOX3T_04495 [Bdellovibrionota bacterium]
MRNKRNKTSNKLNVNFKIKKNYLLSFVVIFSFVVFSFTACNFNNIPFLQKKFSKTENEKIKTTESENLFSMRIVEKVNDGEKVYILGEAFSNEEIQVDKVSVKLRLLKGNGETSFENVYEFADLMGKDKSKFFEKKVPKRFLISLDNDFLKLNSATDFQLELLWNLNEANLNEAKQDEVKQGEDRQREIKDESLTNSVASVDNFSNLSTLPKEALKMVNLSFEKKLVSLNDKEPKYYFLISGELENLSDRVINEITITVSFKSKLSNIKLNKEEEFLEIKGIRIKPHSSKKFEMELDTVLSSQDANIYKPEIKILSFN